MILNDEEIREHIADHQLIEGAALGSINTLSGIAAISWGVTHAGYDIRLAGPILVPKKGVLLDVKLPPEAKANQWRQLAIGCHGNGEYVVIPPNTMALGVSVERFNIPNWLTGLIIGKSTYARQGLVVNCTPLEAGWSGYVTIEIANTQPNSMTVYLGEGIAQCVFMQHNPVGIDYDTKGGKYQNQPNIPVLAKLH